MWGECCSEKIRNSSKVGDHQNQHIIKINKFALNGDFNSIIAISDTLKY